MEERREAVYDVMRAIAMTGVIGFHMGEIVWGEAVFFPKSWGGLWRGWGVVGWSPWYIFSLIGDHAVPLFLFLSGFLLMKKETAFSLKWLWVRMKKLLVPFWLAVLGGSVIVAWVWSWDSAIIERGVAGDFSWDKVIWAALLVQNWSAYTFNSPVPAWWFMGILVQLYLWYGGLKYLIDRLGKKDFFKVIIVVQLVWNLIAIWLSTDSRLLYLVYYNGLSYIALFGLGMWAAKYKVNWGYWGWVMVAVGWGLRLGGGRWLMISEALIGWGWFMGLSKVIGSGEQVWPGITEQMARVGRRWSYHIYLWHQPVLWLGVWFVRANRWGLAW